MLAPPAVRPRASPLEHLRARCTSHVRAQCHTRARRFVNIHGRGQGLPACSDSWPGSTARLVGAAARNAQLCSWGQACRYTPCLLELPWWCIVCKHMLPVGWEILSRIRCAGFATGVMCVWCACERCSAQKGIHLTRLCKLDAWYAQGCMCTLSALYVHQVLPSMRRRQAVGRA